MNLTLLSETGSEPLLRSEAKDYLEIASADTSQDAKIDRLIKAARTMAERWCNKQFVQKQFQLAVDRFPNYSWNQMVPYPAPIWYPDPVTWQFRASPTAIELLDPLITVDEFAYRDSTGTDTPLVAGSDYIVDVLAHPGLVAPAFGKSWPAPALWPSSAVRLKFTSGPSSGGYVVPETVRQAIALLVTQWFESRVPFEAIRFVAELPFSVTALLESERVYQVGRIF